MQPIVTYDSMIARFPNMKPKSAELAKKLLPVYTSSELAAMVAALMTDGHVDWYTGDGRPRTRKAILYSSNRNECEWFINTCNKIFGFEGKVIAYKPKYGFYVKQPYKSVVNNALIAMVMILCGVPAGNKTDKEFLIPDWIMNGTDEIKKEFLKFIFNFEGSAPRRKQNRPCSWQIAFFISKNESLIDNAKIFLSQIISLLKDFGISCSSIGFTKSKNSIGKNPAVYFTITNQLSIVNFYRHIGFYNPEKQKLLRDSLCRIVKMGRLNSKHISDLMRKTKNDFGTDQKILAEINKLTATKYTSRQIEHFRRMETKIPYEILFALIKINKDEKILNQLPPHAGFLYRFSVPSFRK